MSSLYDRVPQELVRELLIAVLPERGRRYRKFQQILARPAMPSEIIVSVTSTGVETRNTACQGDFVVRNLTEAMELYIVPASKFQTRYSFLREETDGWRRYLPRGEVVAIQIDIEILDRLGRTSPCAIEAPWGESQRVELHDFLVTPPDRSEVYRIAQQEFFQTYQLVADK